MERVIIFVQEFIKLQLRVYRETVKIFLSKECLRRQVSVVGIATGYGLGSPGIESRWGRDFPHLSTPVLGPTHPPVQWVPRLSQG